MVAVLFEVVIKESCMDAYLRIAGELKGQLMQAKGFIRSERFQSFADERKLLSVSFWENEGAVTAWRNGAEHRSAQGRGREALFESYRITVASALRSYTDRERTQAPEDSRNAFRGGPGSETR